MAKQATDAKADDVRAYRMPDAQVISTGVETVELEGLSRRYTAVARGIVDGERSVLVLMGPNAWWVPESQVR